MSYRRVGSEYYCVAVASAVLYIYIYYANILVKLKEGVARGGKADNLVNYGASPQSQEEEPELVLKPRVRG